MKKDITVRIVICMASFLLWGAGLALAEMEMELHPINFGNFTTIGILNGTPDRDVFTDQVNNAVENEPFSRIAVWLTQEATINEALLISVGTGGLFFYGLPVLANQPWTRLVKFGPGVNVASAAYRFGDVENPWLNLKMGFFPHKYNPDAKNLGEYLFRSGIYPGVLYTGGWSIINGAGYAANGLLGEFSFLDDRLKLDVGAFMERDLEPNFDISPSVVASYHFGEIAELSAGVVFSHLLSLGKNQATPKKRGNAYTSHAAFADPATGDAMPLPTTQQNLPGLNDDPNADPSVSAVRPVGDPLIGTPLPEGHPSRKALKDDIDNAIVGQAIYYADAIDTYGTDLELREINGLPERYLDYYSFRGQKIMTRAAIRLQNLLELEWLGPEDLTIYGEVTLLGVKDYPFYYEDKMERMPIMFGINLPTFKLLDILCLELEYRKNMFRNSMYMVYQSRWPLWYLDPAREATEWNALHNNTPQTAEAMGLDPTDSDDAEEYQEYRANFPEMVKEFNSASRFADESPWRWSLYAKKTVVPGFRVFLQMARDHFRVIDYGAAPSYEPIFHRKGLFEDWYWALRLEFGA